MDYHQKQARDALTVEQFLILLQQAGTQLSRNRNFEIYEQPTAKRALRLHLMLQKLERNLLAYAKERSVRMKINENRSEHAQHFQLVIENPRLHLKQTIYLSPNEWELLRQKPQLAELVDSIPQKIVQ